jgi:hypothetical protein
LEIVCETLSGKKPSQKETDGGGMAQGVGPEFKPHTARKNNSKN